MKHFSLIKTWKIISLFTASIFLLCSWPVSAQTERENLLNERLSELNVLIDSKTGALANEILYYDAIVYAVEDEGDWGATNVEDLVDDFGLPINVIQSFFPNTTIAKDCSGRPSPCNDDLGVDQLESMKNIQRGRVQDLDAEIETLSAERNQILQELGISPETETGAGTTSSQNNLLVPIPGIGPGEGPLTEVSNLSSYIRAVYYFGIVLASLFALVSIVYAGIVITTSSGNAAKVANAKEIIQQSIFGILLLLGAVIIINTINPDILKTEVSPLNVTSEEMNNELESIKTQIANILNPLSRPRTITIVADQPVSSSQIKTIADYEAVLNSAGDIITPLINILELEIAGLENNPDPLDPDNEILDKKEEVLTAMKEARTSFDINVIWDKYNDLLQELTALRSPATPQKLEAARDLLSRARNFRDFDLQTNYAAPASAISFIDRLEYLDGEFSVYIRAQSSERILLDSCQAESGRLFDEFVTSKGLVPEHYGDHYRYLGLTEPEKAPDGTEVWSLSQTTEGAAIATSLDQYIDDRLPTSCKRDESIYTFSQRCLLEEVESFESFLNSRGIAPDETVEYPSLNNTLIRIGAPHSGIRAAKTGAKSLEEISANLPTAWNNYWGPRKKSDCSAFYLDLTSTKYSSVLN